MVDRVALQTFRDVVLDSFPSVKLPHVTTYIPLTVSAVPWSRRPRTHAK